MANLKSKVAKRNGGPKKKKNKSKKVKDDGNYGNSGMSKKDFLKDSKRNKRANNRDFK